MSLVDLLATTVVALLVWVVLARRVRALGRVESQVVAASFAAHLGSTVVAIVIAEQVYSGAVDFNSFRRAGELVADQMRIDFWEVAPKTVQLFLHQDAWINVPLNLEPRGGRSTVSMWMLAAWGNLLFLRSFQATAAACALFAFVGKLLAYEAFRDYFPRRHHPWVAAAVLLVPSVVFWTSGLIKEAIAVGGLGFALWGVTRLGRGFSGAGVASAGFGLLMVAAIKPYLLISLAAGAAAWVYSVRARGADGIVRVRPVFFALTVAVSVVGVVLVGRLFPQFSVERIGEEAARMQFYGQRAAGGSVYVLGDPSETSLVGQLRFAPLALFTALFRPLVFEATNAQVLVNSFETSAILVATVWLLVGRGWRWMLVTVVSNPGLAFALAFALPLALGVGLVSNNLGTLSRYRCPMVPFLVTTLVVLLRARGDELVALAGVKLPFERVRGRVRRPMGPQPADLAR